MNPCAEGFTPTSTPGIRSTTAESEKVFNTLLPLSCHLEQSLPPLQEPIYHFIAPYTSLPYCLQSGSRQGWNVHPWYNPVIVSERDCGTLPQSLHESPSFKPKAPIVSQARRLPTSSIAIQGSITSSIDKSVDRGRMAKLASTGDFVTDYTRSHVNNKDSEALVPGLKPLACSYSSSRRCAIDHDANSLAKTSKFCGSQSSILGSAQRSPHFDHRQSSQLSKDISSPLLNSESSVASSSRCVNSALPLSPKSPPSQHMKTLRSSDSFCSSVPSLNGLFKYPKDLEKPRAVGSDAHIRASLQSHFIPRETHMSEFAMDNSLGSLAELSPILDRECIRLSTADFENIKHISGSVADIMPNVNCCNNSICYMQSPSYATTTCASRDRRDRGASDPCIPNYRLAEQCKQHKTTGLDLTQKISISDDESETAPFKKTSNKGAFSTFQMPAIPNSVRSAAESGSWSQSKRWMSQLNKERMISQKLMTNLHHLGADKSPFVPHSSAELTAIRAEMKDIKMRRLSREVAALERRREKAKDVGGEEVKPVPLLQGRQFKDKLSPVFASRNCFREHISRHDTQWVEWPSLSEFKDEGDKRPMQHGRRFPLPRLETKAYNYARAAPKVPWQDRIIKRDSYFIQPISECMDEVLDALEPPIAMEEIPDYLQKAMQEMEEELDD